MISTKLVLTQRKLFVQTDLLSGITLVCHPIMDFVEQSRMWGMELPVILFFLYFVGKDFVNLFRVCFTWLVLSCRQRRAARRAALGIAEPEPETSISSRNDRGRQRSDSKNSANDRNHLEVSSPPSDRPRSPRSSPRSSPRPSPRNSPTLSRRRFKFEEPQIEGKSVFNWDRWIFKV